MSKTQELLVCFAQKHTKPTVTVLMKLCYLADLIYYGEHKSKITHYDYERYTFGPFDKKIYSDLEELSKKETLKTELIHGGFGDDTESVVYRINNDKEISIDLGDDIRPVIDELLKALGGRGALELTEIAYKTKPMLKLGATLGGNEGIGEKLDLAAK